MSRRKFERLSGEAGYFLTDALAGLFVLASISGSLVGAFGFARSMADRADHTAKALVIAKSCLEEGSADEGVRTFILDGVEYKRMRFFVSLESGASDAVQLVRVECSAQWAKKGSPREVRLERIEIRAKPR